MSVEERWLYIRVVAGISN